MRSFVAGMLLFVVILGSAPACAGDSAALAPGKKLFSVYFLFGEANLTADGKAVVDAAASFSRSSHGTRIDIVGNTDTAEADRAAWVADKKYLASCKHLSAKEQAQHPLCVWPKPDPVKLGMWRAKAIADRLVADGVQREAIHVASAGASDPAVAPAPATREPLNRRADITIR